MKVHPLYLTLGTVASLILIYFRVLTILFKKEHSKHDILNKKVITAPMLGKNCCSWWPISHFVLFTICAYIWPHKWKDMFVLGVLWEFVEGIIGYLYTPRNEVVRFKNTRSSDGSLEYEQWWSSSYKDVYFNSAGIILGLSLKKNFG